MSRIHRTVRLAIAASIALTIGSAFIAEGALHIWERSPVKAALADAIARQTGSSWRAAQITAADGSRLDGWFFTPRNPKGAGVILMHGVADTRMGMTGHAPFLLSAGYTVLLP